MDTIGLAFVAARRIALAVLALAGVSASVCAEEAAAPAAAPISPAPSQPAAVFDAPGMEGVRMMAPIGDSLPAIPPRMTTVRIRGKTLPMPRPRPGSLAQASPEPAIAQAPAAAASPSLTTPAVSARLIAPKIGPTMHANMVQAFSAAMRGDWARARSLALLTGDPVFGALIQWRYLVELGAGAPFEEINSFLQAHPNWPRREALIGAAERSMPEFTAPRQVVEWYGARVPLTAKGKMRLGEALIAADQQNRGVDLIRKGWIEGSFTPTEETEILKIHRSLFTQADQRARLQQLLARNDSTAARRQLLRVDADVQRITNARLRIKASPALAKTVIAGLPESLKGDSELRFDAARALRARRQDQDAWAMLAETTPSPMAAAIAEERWTERHIMTRDALKAGAYDVAYGLVSRHGMESGGGFADAEFIAGWIALRYLHRPEVALGHFRTLANGVMLPISKARAYYWLGRTYEELGQTQDAIAAYRKAAESHETFYGQLALARIEERPAISFPDVANAPSPQERDAFEGDERVIAIRLLADLADRDRVRLFAIRIANDTPNVWHLDMLAQLMTSLNDPAMSVRVAKIASYSGIVLPSRLAPIVPIPRFPGAGTAPDPALVLGLARQESEFDPAAVSSAGARGLMQLMPASARKAAQTHGLTYRLGDLIAKPQYNMQLGMATIADYLDQWGGSYVLAIASYNAGAGNVIRWIETNGDPRDPMVDPIDWIERIPFGETRNYVQRVLENIQIYRSRLSGSGRLKILADLYSPQSPRGTVLAYNPPPAAPSPETPAAPAPEQPAAALEPVQTNAPK